MSERTLSQKLLSIMAGLGTVTKKGYNEFSKYSYVRESDIAKAFQALCIEHSVFVTSSVIKTQSRDVRTAGDKPALFSQVTVEYTFINADNPAEERLFVTAVGEGVDTGDKAIYKALTGAHKYMLIRNFNLGSEDDAETESPEIAPQGKTATSAPANGASGQGFF